MLDEKDLRAIREMIQDSEQRMNTHMTEMANEARHGAVHDMQVIIENTIMPSLKLLAEGQQTILQTMTPKSKTEELEEELDFLKAIVRSQSQRIDALEQRLA